MKLIPRDHITILGGGPAGLAAGYYAKKKGMPFTIYEARPRLGGNAITLQHGEFRFDTGAHRFHNKNPEITREIKELLGGELLQIKLPSHIYDRGRFVNFPFTPLNLLRTLSLPTLLKATSDLIRARLLTKSRQDNFAQLAVATYGRTIAERFLLNYSEKLWGYPCELLSVDISGGRLSGLNLLGLLREILLGNKANPFHLEGTFYYPRLGYGMIADALAGACGDENIHVNSPVHAMHHDGSRIESVSIRGGEAIGVEEVISTIPLPLLLGMLDPPPPVEYLELAKSLRFRNLIVVAVFIDQERVTRSATVYFPEEQFPFTRIYEPINRSRLMAPPGKTSLCVEYPCFPIDAIWLLEKEQLIDLTCDHLEKIGWIRRDQVIGGEVIKLSHAYPVLEVGVGDKIKKLLDYLSRFSNLRLVGRNGRFVYTHVHDMLRFGLEVIEDLWLQKHAKDPASALLNEEN